jgi:hypothetical protein
MHTSARTLLVGSFLIGALGAAAGCSSGSSASSQFCQDSASKLCSRAYTCTPTAMQDAAFHASWGPSEKDCTALFDSLCTQNCAGKTSVSEMAKTTCYSEIDSPTCDVILSDTYTNSCDSVCIAAPTGGGGVNGGGGAAGGTGTGGAGGTSAAERAFCVSSWMLLCTHAFQCVPAASRDATFIALFGNTLAECNGMSTATCNDPACSPFDPSSANACLSALASLSCTSQSPAICNTACP